MINKINLYWACKSRQERFVIFIFLLFSILTVSYYFFIKPVTLLYLDKKKEVHEKKELWTWMNEQAPKILPKKNSLVTLTVGDPLTLIDTQFKTYSKSMNLSKNANGTILVDLKEIDFNFLWGSILDLQNKYNISIQKIKVQKLDNVGRVQASIIFQIE